MADSNTPQPPKTGIPTPTSNSLLKKPGTGIPSRLPTGVKPSSTIRKSTSIAENASLSSSSSSSIPPPTNLTKIPSGSNKSLTGKEIDEPTSSRSSLSSTSSSSIPPPTNLTKIPSGSNKNLAKPEIKNKDESTPKRESIEKTSQSSLVSSSSSSLTTPITTTSRLAPPSSLKPKTEPKIESKLESQPELKQDTKQDNTSNEENINLKKEIKDLNEKLETLKLKRAEDREKLRELDKLKLNLQTLLEFKTQAQEMISQLNKDLQISKQEAKTYKDEYEAYKDEMSSHESRLEELTVDKELAEARVEELQEEMNKLNEKYEETKLELDVLKGEMEINGVEGAVTSFQTKQLEKEAETLKLALIKLRDLNIQDKAEISSLKKSNEEMTQKISRFQKEIDVLKEEKETFLVQISELNEQVTATLGSEQIIERLSERNLDLESKVAKLEEEISDLEAINDVNDQLQENAKEEEKELRQNLDLAESRIRESEKQIELLKYNIADHEKTILKFRDLVKQLQNENDTISRQLKNKLEEEKETMSQAVNSVNSGQNFDFKQKFFESQIQSKYIENEINLIELQSSRKYSSYLLSFMTESFLKQSGNNECIMTLLFFRRISNKCDLILNHFKEKINKINSNENASKSNLNGQLGFFYDLSVFSSRLKLLCNKFDYILNSCDLKVFLNIGTMYDDFNINEKQIDSIIDLIQRNQLDENISTDGIDKMSVLFQNIINNHLKDEKYDHNAYLEDLVRYAIFSTETISVEIQKLNSLAEVKDDSSEIFLLFREISCKNDEIKASLKKLQRNMPIRDSEKSKNVLIFPNEFLNEFENSIENFNLISKSLKELYNLASNSKIFSSTNETFEPMSGKKLESLAYQACDKIYIKDDNGPYENLRNSFKQINEIITRANICLENGEYEIELSDEEFKIRKYQVNSPIQKSAELFKNTLVEAESIKFKLEDKEEEIKELKKNLKHKVDELSEQKIRLSIVEKKSETQQKELEEKIKKLNEEIEEIKAEQAKKEKEHSDTLEALQQELDSLEKDRKELKDKIRKATFNEIRQSLTNSESLNHLQSNDSPSLKTQNSLIDSSSLVQEINVLKCQNKLLQKSLNEAKQAYVNSLMNDLPQNNFNSDFNILVKNTDEKHKNFIELTKKTNDLLKDVYSSFANVKIEDLTKKVNHRIDRNKLEEKNLYLQVNKIQEKLANLQKELVTSTNDNGKIVNSSKRNLIAEISMPVINSKVTSGNRVIDLNVNLDEIKHIMRNF
ncbi:unnamed protein product [Brachionus calyciflorus]|uniref:Dynein associated protein domain-containing protein n=1 Tax=Brachionus calyciflorus TaxID=104777 RepID=A0A813TAA9_9BILA|nr:unnamed protein product [Brachionus calyciflorus]